MCNLTVVRLIIVVTLASSGLFAVDVPVVRKTTVTRRACVDIGFEKSAWPQLQALEPRLKIQFDSIKTAYASVSKETLTFETLDNCTVEYPIDEGGKAVDGYRVVIMDKTWYGNEGKDEYKGGLKIVYFVNYEDPGTQYETRKRKVYGFSLCKDPVTCNILGIPVQVPAVDPNRPNNRPAARPEVPVPAASGLPGSDFPV